MLEELYKNINKRLGQIGMRENPREAARADPDSFRVILVGMEN